MRIFLHLQASKWARTRISSYPRHTSPHAYRAHNKTHTTLDTCTLVAEICQRTIWQSAVVGYNITQVVCCSWRGNSHTRVCVLVRVVHTPPPISGGIYVIHLSVWWWWVGCSRRRLWSVCSAGRKAPTRTISGVRRRWRV